MPTIKSPIKAMQFKQATSLTAAHDKFSGIDRWLLRRVRDSLGGPPIRLMLENGAEVSSPENLPVATIVIQDRSTLFDLIRDPEGGFGEAYRGGRITVEGNLVAALEAANRAMADSDSQNWNAKIVSRFLGYA